MLPESPNSVGVPEQVDVQTKFTCMRMLVGLVQQRSFLEVVIAKGSGSVPLKTPCPTNTTLTAPKAPLRRFCRSGRLAGSLLCLVTRTPRCSLSLRSILRIFLAANPRVLTGRKNMLLYLYHIDRYFVSRGMNSQPVIRMAQILLFVKSCKRSLCFGC